MLRWPDRTTRTKLDYGYDWGPLLEQGETIVDSDYATTYDIEIYDEHMNGTVQTIWVRGGSTNYAQITLFVTTDRGRGFDQAFRLDTTA